jgi:carbonic anhydrase
MTNWHRHFALTSPQLTNQASTSFDASALLEPVDNRSYYRFSGSLTTPPCSEGVRWLVMKQPLSLSPEQFAVFRKNMHSPNNRPLQEVHGRPVLE